MKIKRTSFLFLYSSLMIVCSPTYAQSSAGNKSSSGGSGWANEPPIPYGISVSYTHTARNAKITDVSVQLTNQDPYDITDFSTLPAKNTNSVTAIKLDSWISPLINLYVLAGYANTEANVNAGITVDSILTIPPVDIAIQTRTDIKGMYLGIGTSFVAGYKSWFFLADVNYGESLPDKQNNAVNFTMFTARTGFQRNLGDINSIKAWLGTMYMDSKTILEIKVQPPTLGETIVHLKERVENPWTVQFGLMLTLSRQFELMTEFGTNFKDANVSVVSVGFRF